MSASYPASIRTFTKKRDLLDIVLAADINLVYDEVTAIETVLGSFPATNLGWDTGTFNQNTLTWPTVRARIQNIEYGLFQAFNDRVRSSGGTTLEPSTISTIGLTLKARAGQTADLFQARTNLDVVVTRITSGGMLQINNSDVLSAAGVQTLSNKTISGANNTFLNIPTASVIVSGSTNIRQYVDARPTVFYQASAPTGVIPGTIWVDSSQNIDPFDSGGLLLKSDASAENGVFGYRRIMTATSAPTASDGVDGDIWMQYV
jgi:hypothetical protein